MLLSSCNLLSGFQGSSSLHRVCLASINPTGDGLQILDRRKSAPLLLSSPGSVEEDWFCSISVQGLVDRWHQQEQIHSLTAPSLAVASQLCKLHFEAGSARAIKRRFSLMLDHVIEIPVFTGPLQCTRQLYRLSSVLIHLGDTQIVVITRTFSAEATTLSSSLVMMTHLLFRWTEEQCRNTVVTCIFLSIPSCNGRPAFGYTYRGQTASRLGGGYATCIASLGLKNLTSFIRSKVTTLQHGVCM